MPLQHRSCREFSSPWHDNYTPSCDDIMIISNCGTWKERMITFLYFSFVTFMSLWHFFSLLVKKYTTRNWRTNVMKWSDREMGLFYVNKWRSSRKSSCYALFTKVTLVDDINGATRPSASALSKTYFSTHFTPEHLLSNNWMALLTPPQSIYRTEWLVLISWAVVPDSASHLFSTLQGAGSTGARTCDLKVVSLLPRWP